MSRLEAAVRTQVYTYRQGLTATGYMDRAEAMTPLSVTQEALILDEINELEQSKLSQGRIQVLLDSAEQKLKAATVLDGVAINGSDSTVIDANYFNRLGARSNVAMMFQFFHKPEAPEERQPNQAFLDYCLLHGIMPVISLEPTYFQDGTGIPTRVTVDQLNAGIYDDFLDRWFQAIKAYGRHVGFRFAHEMNGDWYHWGLIPTNLGGPGMTSDAPAIYLDLWDYVYDRREINDADNALLIWCPNIPNVPTAGWNTPAAYWPGSKKVDINACDSYNGVVGDPTPGLTFAQSLDRNNMYQEIRNLDPEKPFWVCETGTLGTDQEKRDWYFDAIQTCVDRDIQCLTYFDNDKSGLDRRLPQDIYLNDSSTRIANSWRW
jgi:hypothetical protein